MIHFMMEIKDNIDQMQDAARRLFGKLNINEKIVQTKKWLRFCDPYHIVTCEKLKILSEYQLFCSAKFNLNILCTGRPYLCQRKAC